MKKSYHNLLIGYQKFRKKYASDNKSVMKQLSTHGQQPEVMVVACCDSRVDPALILQCDPGAIFVVRNVANIVPPYVLNDARHDTSAALEFGVNLLKVKHLILLGHSQCGGIKALMHPEDSSKNDFIINWVSQIKTKNLNVNDLDSCAKNALKQSYENCKSFPWIDSKVKSKELIIHLWFFEIETGQIFSYCKENDQFDLLVDSKIGFGASQTK